MSWSNRANLAIAQGALTNSKRPANFIRGVYPTHGSKGSGCRIYADGKMYVDYICGLGSNLIGYGHPLLAEAVNSRYLKGSTLSLSTEVEVEVAECLKEMVPFTDLWKFTKTGTEACSAAIRIARAYTGREEVLSEGYHGWSDDFISLTEPALGVPKREWMDKFDWDLISNAAAVIVEPVITDFSNERRQFLHKLRDECTKWKTLLIFDEIITGFRFPGYTVSKYFSIEPDIILLGKALGGGMPLSAVGGKKHIMNCGEYFVSGTFFGEACSLEAAKTLLNLLKRDGKYSIKDLWEQGQIFLEKFNALDPEVQIEGYPTRGAFKGNEFKKALFWQEACKAGILFGPSWFFNFPLAKETDQVLLVCRDIFTRIKLGHVKLEGEMPVKPFAQKVRG